MAELKTKPTEESIEAFLERFVEKVEKKQEAYRLIELMQEVTGAPPIMWGESIIGFGQYHYKSSRSRQEGDWPLIGFSPRKAAISLYVYSGLPEHSYLLENLGKYKMGKACIYVKKIGDIDEDILKKLMLETIAFLKTTYKS